jgi:single-strand DNA-binding protein
MTNKVELTGNAGSRPEVTNLNDGKKVVNFTLATTESYKSKNGELVKNTTWHKIVMWNKLADQAQTLIKKGTQISLTGKIVNRNYTDAKGVKHYITEIYANGFETVKTDKTKELIAA